MSEGYFLGLDMGTGSLGWAVTDLQYEILRKHGKALWGVRLFENANTAEQRRTFRTARRRLDRRGWRIQVLQEIFSEEIMKVDPGFYLRMKESKYYPEDKRDMSGKCPELPYTLFVDKDYTDKDYHRKEQFPTIYHLRKMLMETQGTPDIRLVYLAFHHMMKHRGHFLLQGDIDRVKEFKSAFEQFLKHIRDEELDFNLAVGEEEIQLVEETLKSKELSKSMKKAKMIRGLGANTVCEKAVLNLLSGGTVKLSDIFKDSSLDTLEKPKISFSDRGYEENIGTIEMDLGERYIIIESAKAVYDWSVLVDILGDSSSISEAKVKIYKKHEQDLKALKCIAKMYFTKEEYQDIFVRTDESLNNYCAYIGMTKKNGKKVDLQSQQCSKEEFYYFLKKNVIKNLEKIGTEETDNLADVLQKQIEKGDFLPKQVTKDNSVIPYQIHKYELEKIIENLRERIPLLKENAEKIRQLFEFRIPYYVGPVNTVNSQFAWAERKSDEKIYPWNFEKIIDVEASAEKFIRHMTNKCTYLFGEDVLPKDSILYSKYMVLNELNNLRLNGEKISVELKQNIYEGLFCKTRKVTQRKLRDYLRREGIIGATEEISGIDGDFKGSLKAYHDFKEKLTGVQLSVKEKEEIILNIALFGEDKKLLTKRIKRLFPELAPGQLKSVCSLSYKGWGRLSKKFLEQIIIPAPESGETWNIITALWETNDNLMQLLSKDYAFIEKVNDHNIGRNQGGLSYKAVDGLYVSPSVKRQIWQTLQIVKEIQKIMGEKPKRVFIEMAREKQESKRTESRKKQLLDLYKVCKNEERNWIEELGGYKDNQLRSDKLYLYYTQKGRCMYSEEEISLGDLLGGNTKYDIDHIYPQSKTMDDSLNNRVLVKRELNKAKSDNYPIAPEVREKRSAFWGMLLAGGFISKEKYNRLMRKEELQTSELAGFIERQIVETRQSTKAVAEILRQALPGTEIVYVKAKTVSHFRQGFDLVKVREMNDLHHAKDAYLNIVVGNSYFVKFTKDAAWYIRENPGRTYNLEKMFTSNYDIARNGEVAWKAGSGGTISVVKKYMGKNNILVTRKAYEAKGELFDQQLKKKGKGQVAIKGSDARLSDIGKYGGYNKAKGAYFILVKSKDKKGREIRSIEFIPLYLKDRIEQSEEEVLKYLIHDRGLADPQVLLWKIKKDTLFNVDGFKMWLSARTGERLEFKGANQLILSTTDMKILKRVLKFVQRKRENKEEVLSLRDGVDEEDLLTLYDAFLGKIKNALYGKQLSVEEKTLTDKRSVFIELSKEEKCQILSEILHIFQCQSSTADLKIIGGSGSAGLLRMNKNITECCNISIINQSPTGVYEQEIDLLRVGSCGRTASDRV